MQDNSQVLKDRAMAAYFRHEATGDGQLQQPSEPEHMTIDGKEYIVLSNTHGILKVYRVRNDGKLKGLKRWPAEIGEKA